MRLAAIILAASSLYLSAAEYGKYKIAKGDSFSSISKKVRVPVNTLIKVNPNITPTRMKIGQEIKYPVKPIEARLNESLRSSENLINYIEGCEGFVPTNYWDNGQWAIGFGHKIKPTEKFKEPITIEQARQQLRKDLLVYEEAVKLSVNVPLNQNQFDALVSLTYNIGEGRIVTSPVIEALNKKDYIGASKEFMRYNTEKGKFSMGLNSRRNIERQLFLK